MKTVARLLGWAFAFLLRLQALTWHVRYEGIDKLDRLVAAKRPFFTVFWHGRYVPLFALLRVPGARIFTSRSFRGDVISEICRRFGFRSVEIEAHGGQSTVEKMRRALAGSFAAALAVDGPLGPAHVVKRGVVELASTMGWVVLPVSVASRRRRVLADRWDRMEIPRLFTEIALVVGDPIEVPPHLDAEGVKAWCLRIRDRLDAIERRSAAIVEIRDAAKIQSRSNEPGKGAPQRIT